jgi:hypothetical protein
MRMRETGIPYVANAVLSFGVDVLDVLVLGDGGESVCVRARTPSWCDGRA